MKEKKKKKGFLDRIRNFFLELFNISTGEAEYGYDKLNERDEKGVGPNAVFGSESNFAGVTTKQRKANATYREYDQQRQANSVLFQRNIGYLINYAQSNKIITPEQIYANKDRLKVEYVEYTGTLISDEQFDVVISSMIHKIQDQQNEK